MTKIHHNIIFFFSDFFYPGAPGPHRGAPGPHKLIIGVIFNILGGPGAPQNRILLNLGGGGEGGGDAPVKMPITYEHLCFTGGPGPLSRKNKIRALSANYFF